MDDRLLEDIWYVFVLVLRFQPIMKRDRANQYPQSCGPLFRCLQWTYGPSLFGNAYRVRVSDEYVGCQIRSV